MSQGADSLKAIIFALGANAAIALAKYVAAFITGSGSMLAEAVHSTADCANQGLLLLGLKRSKRPPSSDYPLGFGKETYFWSFIVALLLFSVGGLFSIREGWHKLHSVEPIAWPWLALGVLGFSIVMESVSMWGCLREVNKARGGQPIWVWFRDTRDADLLVIFGEDLAALIGLVVAFAAVSLTMLTGNPVFDALGSIVIGILLVVVAAFLSIEIKALLVGQGVDPQTHRAMLDFLRGQARIKRVFNVLTLQMGKDVMVAVKAEMQDEGNGRALVESINTVEAAFRQQFPQVIWLFFEPDIED